jgi:phage tail-like protein
MAPPARNDPFGAFRFLVEIDGVPRASFTECTGLESETTVIEYRTGDMRMHAKLPGLTRFANIVLRRGLTQDLSLYQWRQTVIDGTPERRNGSVVLLDDENRPVLRWNFRNGWPCKLAGPALNAKNEEVALETLEIAHEGLTLEAG